MITIIGSLNYDLVTFTSRVPEAGETFQGVSFEEHLGGKGMNECVAVASLISSGSRNKVRMWGRVGDDHQGKLFLDKLASLNVDISLLKVLPKTRSGSATILVETESGENRIIIISGANGKLEPTEAELAEAFPESGKQFVVLQNEFPCPLEVLDWLAKNRPNVTTFYNPSSLKKELMKSAILNRVSYLVVNQGEAWSLIGQENHTRAEGASEEQESALVIRKLREFVNDPALIVTLGSKGCIFCEKGTEYSFVASRKVAEVVDTTGAGDTFLGGIVSQLYTGSSLKESIVFATAASALAIQKKGAVEGIPEYGAVMKTL